MYAKGFGTAATGLVLAFVAAGCGPRYETSTGEVGIGAADVPVATTDSTVDDVTVADLADDPLRYVGQTVTVVADVEEVLAPYAFKLDEDAITEGGIDNDLLVLSPKSAKLADIDDQWLNNKVRVTGMVRAVNVIEIEREIGWDLDPEIEVELEKVKAVLIASSLKRAQ